jgi:CheY-like chemotaxis protein
MNLLIIEDNDIKYDLIIECLKELSFDITLRRSASYQSAVESLVYNKFDCVILDMTLPTYDSQFSVIATEQLTFGGKLVLRETARRMIKGQFIVLSQYDSFLQGEKVITFGELRAELMAEYPALVLGCVRLDTSSVQWRSELGGFLTTIHANTHH